MLDRLKVLLVHVLTGAPGYREDAAYDTPFLARELTQIETELYRKEYPDLKFRSLIPIKNVGLNPGATSFVYKIYDWVGIAKFISNFADDLPNVEVKAAEVVAATNNAIGDSYTYSADELLQASMAGIPLDRLEAEAAMEAIEAKLDEVAAIGAPQLNKIGFLTHPNVAVDTPAANGAQNGGGGTSTLFYHKTPLQILTDLNAFVAAQLTTTIGKFPPTTISFPLSLWAFLSSLPMSADFPDKTLMGVFKGMHPELTVDYWNRQETVGEDGGPRIVLYAKNNRHMEFYIPMEARQLPPQERNLAVVVNIWAKVGGFVLRQPLAMRYLDGAGNGSAP